MCGLLIETYAGCSIVQDSYCDEHRYRVLTVHNKCLMETGKLDEAVRAAEEFQRAYLCTTE